MLPAKCAFVERNVLRCLRVGGEIPLSASDGSPSRADPGKVMKVCSFCVSCRFGNYLLPLWSTCQDLNRSPEINICILSVSLFLSLCVCFAFSLSPTINVCCMCEVENWKITFPSVTFSLSSFPNVPCRSGVRNQKCSLHSPKGAVPWELWISACPMEWEAAQEPGRAPVQPFLACAGTPGAGSCPQSLPYNQQKKCFQRKLSQEPQFLDYCILLDAPFLQAGCVPQKLGERNVHRLTNR